MNGKGDESPGLELSEGPGINIGPNGWIEVMLRAPYLPAF